MNLHNEQYLEIEEMAANNFTIREMATTLLLEYKDFKKAFDAPQSMIKRHYEKGRLQSDFTAEEAMRKNAEGGNITAYQILKNNRASKDLKMLKDRILYQE